MSLGAEGAIMAPEHMDHRPIATGSCWGCSAPTKETVGFVRLGPAGPAAQSEAASPSWATRATNSLTGTPPARDSGKRFFGLGMCPSAL